MDRFKVKFVPPLPGIYFVGGSVRDALLGRPYRDIDIVVSTDPEMVAARIADSAGAHRPVKIGKSDKIVYRVITDEYIFDVVRQHGDSIEEDLKRRDFTINAMAVESDSGRMIDPLNGYADLKAGTIRQVSPDVFKNDPVRMLRAFRIAAQLGFSISENTLKTIAENADFITLSAGERIREEWIRFLSQETSFKYLVLMESSGLAGKIFPELAALKFCRQNRHHRYDVFTHSMAAFRHMERLLFRSIPEIFTPEANVSQVKNPALLKHAALLHDIGKASTSYLDDKGSIHFYGHEKTGMRIARKISRRIHFSNDEADYVDFLISGHTKPRTLFSIYERGILSEKTITRFFIRNEPWVPDLLLLSVADTAAKGFKDKTEKYICFTKNLARLWQEQFLPRKTRKRFITGHDLITCFSLPPSPAFRRILEYAEILQRSGKVTTRKDALREIEHFIKEHYGNYGKDD